MVTRIPMNRISAHFAVLGALLTASACDDAAESPSPSGTAGSTMEPGGATALPGTGGVSPSGGVMAVAGGGTTGGGGAGGVSSGGVGGTTGGGGAGGNPVVTGDQGGARAEAGAAGSLTGGSGSGGSAGIAGTAGAPSLGGTGSSGTSGSSGSSSKALSFEADIWPMFEEIRDPIFVYYDGSTYESCTTSGVCHGGSNPGAGLSMVDADTAYEELLDVPSRSNLCADAIRVVVGQPEQSCLIQFYETRLRDELEWVDTSEIDLVRRWIAEGAQP